MDRSAPLALLALAAFAAISARFVLGSEPEALLVSWFPDDAFYYLQPAWNAAHGRGFTLDGLRPTYGVQPLWAAALTALARLVSAKGSFPPVVAGLGLALHALTAGLLWRWLRAAGLHYGAVAAAALWLLNPHLIRMHASGMESGLVSAALMTLLCLAAARNPRAGRLGAALGVLVLARVSAVVIGAWLCIAALRSRRAVVRAGAAFSLILAPWMWAAWSLFGRVTPTSMDRKLVGGPAGAGRFVAELPGVPDALVRVLLPAPERALFDVEALVAPTWSSLWTLGARAPVGWTLGSWTPGALDLPSALLAATLFLVVFWGAIARTTPSRPPLLGVLCAGAALNAAANGLLLAPFVKYGFWYRVPEALAIVAICGVATEHAARAMGPKHRLLLTWLAMFAGTLRLAAGLGPLQYDERADLVARGAMEAAAAMNAHVPAGEQVGSWNAGLLGWLADGPVVVNLDGLANEPAFLSVARQEVEHRHGLAEDPAIVRWLDGEGIRWLIELERPDRVGVEPFYGVVPARRTALVARSRPVSHWSRPGLDHAVVLVALLPDPDHPPAAN